MSTKGMGFLVGSFMPGFKRVFQTCRLHGPEHTADRYRRAYRMPSMSYLVLTRPLGNRLHCTPLGAHVLVGLHNCTLSEIRGGVFLIPLRQEHDDCNLQ